MAAVELRNVSKIFGSLVVIDNVTAAIEAGEFVVFVGPSGSGKSTLLRMIAGLEDVSSGDILIGGEDVTFEEPSDRGIAMVFQWYALYPHMNVYDNIAFNLRLSRLGRSDIDARVREVARTLRIDDLLSRSPAQLSGGQRQRVAIGRAIVRNPRVFLFDEPLSNLDAALRVQMRLEIGRLHRELGATMIYVTHDQVEAMTMADRILVLDAGRVQQAGSPLELYARPENRFVAGFLGSPRMNFLAGAAVSRDERGVTVRLSADRNVTVRLRWLDLDVGAAITLGFRPESVTAMARTDTPPSDILALIGTVETVERLGNLNFAYFNIGEDCSVTAQIIGPVEFEHGDEVAVLVPVAQIHVFNDTGTRLSPQVDETTH